MKAYILAAGYATRLYPLTLHRAKPLLEVAGAPILSHILRRVVALDDLSEVVVVGNHRFVGQLEAWRVREDCALPLRVLDDGSTGEADKLGAIGDIAFAIDRVPPGDEDFVVLAGDNLIDFDLREPQRAFLAGARPLLVLRRVEPRGGPSPYNEVTLGDDGRVVRFREKPEDPATDLAAMALYFLPSRVQSMVRGYLDAGGNPDAPGHFIAWLVDQMPVGALPMGPMKDRWFDIGSLETLAEAQRRFRS